MATIRYFRTEEGGTIRWVEGNNTSETLTGSDTYVDSINGNGGNDVIRGLSLADSLYGGLGNDSINGSYGADLIIGGDGADTLVGAGGNDSFDGGAGRDTVYGGDGDDNGALLGLDADRFSGGAGHDSAQGGRGADSIYGDAGNDVPLGDEDNDLIYGGLGDDQIGGGDGGDRVYGGAGRDEIDGGAGNDLIGTDSLDTLNFIMFQGGTIGEDVVQGIPQQISFRADGTLVEDGREGEIEMQSFLDSNGSGQITGADLWVSTARNDTGGLDLILDIAGIYRAAFEDELTSPQTITIKDTDRIDTDSVLSLFQPNVEFGRPIGIWTGSGIEIREPDY